MNTHEYRINLDIIGGLAFTSEKRPSRADIEQMILEFNRYFDNNAITTIAKGALYATILGPERDQWLIEEEDLDTGTITMVELRAAEEVKNDERLTWRAAVVNGATELGFEDWRLGLERS